MAKQNKKSTHALPDRLYENYSLTEARRDMGIYGERFLDLLVMATRQEGSGMFSPIILDHRVADIDGSRHLKFSVKHLLSSTLDHNYGKAEDAMRKLAGIYFEMRENGVWKLRQLITDPEIDEVNHTASVRVPVEIWTAIQRNDSSFRAFNPAYAYSLSSGPAYHMYKFVSGQSKGLSYSIDYLKKMLGCEGKHKRPNDFISRVIVPVKEQLDSTCDWTFDYKPDVSEEQKKLTKRGRPTIDLIWIFPKRNEKVVSSPALAWQYKASSLDVLPDKLVSYLEQKYMFTKTEITNSRTIIPAYDIMARNHENMLDFLLDNVDRIDATREKKSYVIGMIKKHIFDKYGVALGTGDISASSGTEKRGAKSEPRSLSDILKK